MLYKRSLFIVERNFMNICVHTDSYVEYRRETLISAIKFHNLIFMLIIYTILSWKYM